MSDDPRGPLPTDGTVVVVGASLAGLRAVETLRAEGFTGRLVLVGEELHLPYDRPPLSKQVLAGKWPPEKAMLADTSHLDQLGVELVLGHRASGLDAGARRVTVDDGTVLQADGVVVATGATPRRLPGTDANPDVTVLRTLDDSTELRRRLTERPGRRLVVVGAGFIGAEVASTAAELGCLVTVVEALAVPLSPVLGPEVGAACAALHGRHGVTLRTGVGVAGVVPAADGRPGRVELADGPALEADVVVVGIGVVPAVDWLADSGLTLRNGVDCDRALFAADGVVAAGDLARWPHPELGDLRVEHWQVAAEEGVAAARNLLAGRDQATPFAPLPYFWSDQYGVKIQVLGHISPGDHVEVVDGSLEDERFVALYGNGGRLTAALAVSRPRQLMAYRPLLAAGASWDEALAVAAG